jgi:hypothetical protein
MNYKIKNIRSAISHLSLILVITITTFISLSCFYKGDHSLDLIIENQTNQTLYITVNDYKAGELSPNATIARNGTPDVGEFIIEAKNKQGEVVFLKTYTFENLIRIKSWVYKAVIPPIKNRLENSENASGM